ncbi:MAG: hypothetical protein II703_07275, partial [Ruminococcus sp.]|nr:hypothetical protein [Ruminococcus sp.]
MKIHKKVLTAAFLSGTMLAGSALSGFPQLESKPAAAASPGEALCFGDMNGDQKLSVHDLCIMRDAIEAP